MMADNEGQTLTTNWNEVLKRFHSFQGLISLESKKWHAPKYFSRPKFLHLLCVNAVIVQGQRYMEKPLPSAEKFVIFIAKTFPTSIFKLLYWIKRVMME